MGSDDQPRPQVGRVRIADLGDGPAQGLNPLTPTGSASFGTDAPSGMSGSVAFDGRRLERRWNQCSCPWHSRGVRHDAADGVGEVLRGFEGLPVLDRPSGVRKGVRGHNTTGSIRSTAGFPGAGSSCRARRWSSLPGTYRCPRPSWTRMSGAVGRSNTTVRRSAGTWTSVLQCRGCGQAGGLRRAAATSNAAVPRQRPARASPGDGVSLIRLSLSPGRGGRSP